jgi:hypothetical protein
VTSIVLAALGALLVFAGALLLYARAEILDEDAFADRAAAALDDDATRDVVSTEIVVGLIENGSPDLVAARPVIQQVVDTVIDSRPFKQVFREAALQTNRLLFVRDKRSVAFDLSDGLEVVRFGLESVSPQVAEQLPKNIDLALLKLRKREFATQTLKVADSVRTLGIVVPLLAILCLVASVAIATDRRRGVMRAAIALAAGGIGVVVVLLILRSRVLAGVIGEDELTDQELRDGIAGILDAYLGDLVTWGLVLGLVGLIVGGAAAALDPDRSEEPATRLWHRVTGRPERPVWRAARAIAAIAAGLLVALDPGFALGVAGLLAGAWLVYFGAGELLLMLQPADAGGEEATARKRSFVRIGLVAAGAIVVLGVAIAVLTRDSAGHRGSLPREGCNGSKELCDMRMNEVAFAGTHNSFSAADSDNWLIANQKRTIERQLDDGIRLLLLDPHWGVADAQGRVRTDFEAEGRDRNRVAKALPPETLAAAERLAGSVGVRSESGGERGVYLCHTVCELGATKMSAALDDVRSFLGDNPGEVVILFLEPYVSADEIERQFEGAGLAGQAAVLDRGEPLPTLAEMVKSDKRLVVFTERDADGTVPWYLDGFSFIQDTPLGATRVDELSCKPNRGEKDSPILMLNHWADVFPPRRGANAAFLTKDEILERAHECARRRGLDVGLIATDHYDQGELIAAVDELNAERIAKLEETSSP